MLKSESAELSSALISPLIVSEFLLLKLRCHLHFNGHFLGGLGSASFHTGCLPAPAPWGKCHRYSAGQMPVQCTEGNHTL